MTAKVAAAALAEEEVVAAGVEAAAGAEVAVELAEEELLEDSTAAGLYLEGSSVPQFLSRFFVQRSCAALMFSFFLMQTS